LIACEIHPLPLCACFPDAFVSLPSKTFVFNCLSWGFPKTPLHRFTYCGSPLRVPGCPGSFGNDVASALPGSVPPVSHRFDGFLLQQPADMSQPASDPGVHRVSSWCEPEIPACACLPFEAFPPLVATFLRVAMQDRGVNVRAFLAGAFTILPSPPVLDLGVSTEVEPQGFAPRGGSVASTFRFQKDEPGAPLGFDQSVRRFPGFRRILSEGSGETSKSLLSKASIGRSDPVFPVSKRCIARPVPGLGNGRRLVLGE